MTGGKVQQPRKRKSLEIESDLLNVVLSYQNNENHDILEYLQEIALNVHLYKVNKQSRAV